MLRVRLAEGMPARWLDEAALAEAARMAGEGLLADAQLAAGRIVLTRRGRLLADAVVRALLG
jgi:oxygen-independent coproporphyrinogen-3 oxidase